MPKTSIIMTTSWLHIWNPILINRSNRPILQDNEYNIYIRDNVGLYQGRQKIVNRQNGRIYLTNKRLIYFDNSDSSKSIAVELKLFKNAELVAGYFRRSPKVTLYIKTENGGTTNIGGNENGTNSKNITIDWVCKICSFNNHLASDYKINENELPKCTSCGIRPSKSYLSQILESAQNNVSVKEDSPASMTPEPESVSPNNNNQCPKCTFINHPALRYCEICGTELKPSNDSNTKLLKATQSLSNVSINSNPLNLKLETGEELYTNNQPYIKLSFRKGGESKFYQEVCKVLDDMKWQILEQKGGINKDAVKLVDNSTSVNKNSTTAAAGGGGGGGIHALERLGELQRKQNEIILTTSLDDLEQLMFKYQDLIKLSTSFNKLIKQPLSSTTTTTTTKSGVVIPALSIKKSSPLYHQELSRHISEFLINFKLTQKTSMISSQDLFAEYNRFLIRNQGFGSALVNCDDFKCAIELFDELNLPVVVKQYMKSDIYVIRPKVDANIYGQHIVQYLKDQEYEYKLMTLRREITSGDYENINNELYNAVNYGKTVSEISNKFNWSYNITIEELEKCVETGSVVIDHHISGTFYYVNKFPFSDGEWDDSKEIQEMRELLIKEQQEITLTLRNEYVEQNMDNLVNIDPDYNFFGVGNEEDKDELESTVTTSVPESQTQSFNDLVGLQF
ncbi:vacuolar protein sorting protein, putative [Candida dubliniensis CD36]|uniref:Vacuolar protein-sorting-associated protein 36 n=1 Tax=Candida dubliniensis (strain CD36 / ATCC MYA-646 / CBS 7987 / NCPF 3949 / NRRL Y-17841) TaxID=573826 RepID=B9WBA0_CANDC|nr:vacuolar protein sorting protein, putative [Candida dubliniensis CD36]CAX43670.1 vacuolar protein sorting protein, putative [Candida dubliniensis CD36]